MKVLYDHQMFSRQRYGGITKYFCELMKNHPEGNSYILSLLLSANQHLKDDYKTFKKIYFPLPQKDSRLKGRLKSKLYKLNNAYSRYQISTNKYDLLHPTYFDPYFLNLGKRPYIVTVHDLIVFKFENVYRKTEQMEEMSRIIHNSKRIIAVSKNTKNDLITILRVPADKIDVIYHGYNAVEIENKVNPYDRYILYVGGRGGYKNFSNFIKVFQSISIDDKELKLICVGAPFSKKESEELEKLKILEKTFAMGVNEFKLNELYSNALAFVYPTLYEGFGMSILEAFANNCPVCLSNTSSLPEVAGNAGVYFDPTDPDSISDAIKKVIYDVEFSKKMIDAGKRQLENFSWGKTVEQTIISYQEAVS